MPKTHYSPNGYTYVSDDGKPVPAKIGEWIYYPDEAATRLKELGISAIIHCPSGRIIEV